MEQSAYIMEAIAGVIFRVAGVLGIVQGLLEIVPTGMIWLVFFAPVAYHRWIEGAAPA